MCFGVGVRRQWDKAKTRVSNAVGNGALGVDIKQYCLPSMPKNPSAVFAPHNRLATVFITNLNDIFHVAETNFSLVTTGLRPIHVRRPRGALIAQNTSRGRLSVILIWALIQIP